MNDPKITGIAAGAVGKIKDATIQEPKKPVENEPKKSTLEKTDENEQVVFECADGKDDGKISFGEKAKALWNGLKLGFKQGNKKIIDGIKNFFGIKTEDQKYKEKLQEIEKEINNLEEKIKQDVESSEAKFS